MKKLTFLMTALLAVTVALYAEDQTVTETFSKVTQTGAAAVLTTWDGDLCNWEVLVVRRGANDTLSSKAEQGTWISRWNNTKENQGVKDGILQTTAPVEGGIKAISFPWKQWASELGNTLLLEMSLDDVAFDTLKQVCGDANDNTVKAYSKVIECKKNAVLKFRNISFVTSTGVLVDGKGRFIIGNITMTPYLRYTEKNINISKKETPTYKNTSLINNTEEGTISYSSSAPEVATVAEDGTVTPLSAGTTIITATWGEAYTYYALHVSALLDPQASFEKEEISVVLGENIAIVNPLTHSSDATPQYSSSDPGVATVDNQGGITIVGAGTTVITATLAETATYEAAEVSYTLTVRDDRFHMETFDGAENVALTSNNTYLTTPTTSFNPSTATGLKWTTLLGSVRDTLGSWNKGNNAVVIRARKTSEASLDFGYALSDTVHGGIDSLAFDWNSNGSESSRTNTWNIEIYINDSLVGAITDKCGGKQPAGQEFRYTLGGLKIEGDFVFKFVNNRDAGANSNYYRWVMDNLEWYSYSASGPETKVENIENTLQAKKVMVNGMIYIQKGDKLYNLLGAEVR